MSDPFLIQLISENSKKENSLGSFFSYVEISAFPKILHHSSLIYIVKILAERLCEG